MLLVTSKTTDFEVHYYVTKFSHEPPRDNSDRLTAIDVISLFDLAFKQTFLLTVFRKVPIN